MLTLLISHDFLHQARAAQEKIRNESRYKDRDSLLQAKEKYKTHECSEGKRHGHNAACDGDHEAAHAEGDGDGGVVQVHDRSCDETDGCEGKDNATDKAAVHRHSE